MALLDSRSSETYVDSHSDLSDDRSGGQMVINPSAWQDPSAAEAAKRQLESYSSEINSKLTQYEETASRRNISKIIGNSKKMASVYSAIEQVAASDTTVFIFGESGVGKEMVARAIHENSNRSSKSFVKINCASFPESMVESELFGHEKGAFNGAVAERKGRLELAEGGTVYFDEIADFSLATQAKLLRMMQEKQIERVGGCKAISTKFRIIAATNKDLTKLIEQGKFREDFYYQLNVFPIGVPALRERPADIVLLADHFVEKYNKILNKNVRRISTPAIDMLMTYHWPGNVREMENCFERAVLITADGVIQSHHLPPSLQTAEQSRTGNKGTLRATLDRVEYELIMDSLKINRGNMAKTARELGMSERVIGLRVRKYKIDCSRF